MHPDQEKWDTRYRNATPTVEAAAVLRDNVHLLPPSGRALDLACGLGGNAILLAQHGLDTQAWDLSPVAIERLQVTAQDKGLHNLTASVRDVEHAWPEPNSFNVITVSFFLSRDMCPALIAALKPDGLLFYQTFTRTKVSDCGPSNPEFRLADDELLTLFAPLQVLVYREEGTTGDTSHGFRDQAMLVAKKKSKG